MLKSPTLPTLIPNQLLAALPKEEYNKLRRHLEPVNFTLKYSLAVLGQPIDYVYFPSHGVMSLLVPISGGGSSGSMEVAIVGNEGMVGIHAYLGYTTAPLIAFCQVPGEGLRMAIDTFIKIVKQAPLSAVLNRYVNSFLMQMAIAGACNRLHPIEERCARWLLMAQDRAGTSQFVLTQEFLAKMLGVRREAVNAVAKKLKKAGFIRYSRGKLTILNRKGLEAEACACYKDMKMAFKAG